MDNIDITFQGPIYMTKSTSNWILCCLCAAFVCQNNGIDQPKMKQCYPSQ